MATDALVDAAATANPHTAVVPETGAHGYAAVVNFAAFTTA